MGWTIAYAARPSDGGRFSLLGLRRPPRPQGNDRDDHLATLRHLAPGGAGGGAVPDEIGRSRLGVVDEEVVTRWPAMGLRMMPRPMKPIFMMRPLPGCLIST